RDGAVARYRVDVDKEDTMARSRMARDRHPRGWCRTRLSILSFRRADDGSDPFDALDLDDPSLHMRRPRELVRRNVHAGLGIATHGSRGRLQLSPDCARVRNGVRALPLNKFIVR